MAGRFFFGFVVVEVFVDVLAVSPTIAVLEDVDIRDVVELAR
jgi:hypothetical protein